MKKKIAVITGLIGMLVAIIIIITNIYKKTCQKTYTIIGGADGPTAVFLASKVSPSFIWSMIAAGIIVLIVSITLFIRWKKKKKDQSK